jgi:tetratricopeptide (TPR) repeat protein
MDIDEFLESEGSDGENKGGRKELVEKQSAEFITDLTVEAQINKIRELIQAKHYKDAEKIYFTVKEQYATLAKRQEDARRKIHRELSAINKELLEHLDVVKKDMEQKTLIISDLLQKAQQYMLKGDTEKANQLYLQVREIFKQIPDAFAERKAMLENQILTFYSQLVNEFNKKNYGKLLEKRDEIMRNIEIATNYLKLGNVEQAKKQYQQINKLYNELPDGFLYEKTIIYKRVLSLHQMMDEGVYQDTRGTEQFVAMDMQGMQGLPSLQAVPPPLSTSSLQSSPKSLEPVSSESPPSSSVPKPLDAAPGLGVAQAPAKKGFFGFLQKQKKAMDAPPLPI